MRRDVTGLGELALPLRRLLLKDVAREGVTAADLAFCGQLEALLRARMGLHLRHDGRCSMTKKPRSRPYLSERGGQPAHALGDRGLRKRRISEHDRVGRLAGHD